MTVKERNDLICEIVVGLKVRHENYFPAGKSLTDSEWEKYIEDMNSFAGEYKDTNLKELAADLAMAFLDDTEMVDKKWKEVEKGRK